ncbi:hypothetical protein [Dyella silvatica]|uniref:hypothetical protein n=1 Tax=Dyella silvatica TaxID=2992128 RepID=UPI00224E06D4|nr:hypothetical protein [Dyella silvatica]
MTRRIRCIGLIAISLLFLISVFRLVQLSTVSPDKVLAHCSGMAEVNCGSQPLANLWRGLALGSLYLLFCLQPRRSVPPAQVAQRPRALSTPAISPGKAAPARPWPSDIHSNGRSTT